MCIVIVFLREELLVGVSVHNFIFLGPLFDIIEDGALQNGVVCVNVNGSVTTKAINNVASANKM